MLVHAPWGPDNLMFSFKHGNVESKYEVIMLYVSIALSVVIN